MATATKQGSRGARKGVKSEPKRKTAKKSRTKSRRGNLRLVKKPGRKKSRRSKKFKGSKEISIKRVIARNNDGATMLLCEGWTAENRRGEEFIGRRPSWCMGQVVDEDWSNLNNIDPMSKVLRAFSNGRDDLVDEMLEEFEEARQEFNGEYEADDDDDDDFEDEEDDDYDD